MVVVKNLTKDYGPYRAVDDISFTVNSGEVVGFLGPNGAGKSTTMKIITGFMAPSSGVAEVGGFDVFDEPIKVKQKIGYLPEIPPLYSDMRVQEYLRFVAKLKGVPGNMVGANVENALKRTSTTDVKRRIIGHLSKGFRQRVGIAQALVSDPEVLILDEPTVGLDPKQVAEIRQLIGELRQHHTVILSTHILPEVQATCQRIIIIHKGKIVAEDTLENLSTSMQNIRKLKLVVRRPNDELTPSLKGLSGVRKVEKGGRPSDWELELDDNDDAVEGVVNLVTQKGVGLLELNSLRLNLEDVFLKLTYGNEPESAADGTSSEGSES